MPAIPKFGDSENNLIAKIAINIGPNPPTRGDGRWNLTSLLPSGHPYKTTRPTV